MVIASMEQEIVWLDRFGFSVVEQDLPARKQEKTQTI